MFINKNRITPEYTQRMYIFSAVFLVLIFLGIFFAYWRLQIVQYDRYRQLAIGNIMKTIELAAPRGLILDRNGAVLSENKINFTLFLIRESIRDLEETIRSVAAITGRSLPEVRKAIAKYNDYPGFYMIPLKNNLPLAQVVYIESRQDEFPELRIGIEPTRTYPSGTTASHVLGYISEISAAELKQGAIENYQIGSVVGISGIEKQYEGFLKGVKGQQTVIKDNQGRIQQMVREEKPVIGDSVMLTIDLTLQKFIEEQMGAEKGAVGVVDLESGGILAMVSTPNFNPDIFSTALAWQDWQTVINDPEYPLENRFLQGRYSPGSVFKIVMALAALQEKLITPDTAFFCSGSLPIYDRTFHCWNSAGHGLVNLYEALRNSCNIYFYNLGKRLDIDTIARYASWLGLGHKTNIDLPNELDGLVPTSDWKLKTFGYKWFPGETISVAIGHGQLVVTPAQMLNMVATVARRGRIPNLHLLQKIERNGVVEKAFNAAPRRVPIDEANIEAVIEGLFRVVNAQGTGWAAAVPEMEICGKTGTSQIIAKDNPRYQNLTAQKRFRPHSWFVSFAPRHQPRIAMVILVENGGDGSRVAAPLAAKIYRQLADERLL